MYFRRPAPYPLGHRAVTVCVQDAFMMCKEGSDVADSRDVVCAPRLRVAMRPTGGWIRETTSSEGRRREARVSCRTRIVSSSPRLASPRAWSSR